MRMQEESQAIHREPCPSCRQQGNDSSGDNLVRYSDGHGYCFACEYFQKGDNVQYETKVPSSINFSPINGECISKPNRLIDEKTTKLYNYQTAKINGQFCDIANYYRDGKLIAQHIRTPDKKFVWRGDTSNLPLWGQNLWSGAGKKNKRIIITEGEIDCMSVNMLLQSKWPVVSLPNGAASAIKSVKQNLEFITSYEEIVLCFDQDEAGRAAMARVAEVLPPGKCYITSLPYKDANECLMNKAGKDVINSVWQAQVYAPDEILHVKDIKSKSEGVEQKVYGFPFDTLTEFLVGQRSGEITLWCSGTGSGKTTILKELVMHHLDESRSVGAIMLEEAPQETLDDMISIMINKPVRALKAAKTMNDLRIKLGKEPIDMQIVDEFTEEMYNDAKEKLNDTKLYIYDHLGHSGLSNLFARMEYMAVSLGVEVIILDHITAAAVGLATSDDNYDSERMVIDNLMKEMRSLVSRTGVRIDVVSQLKKTTKAYEEGDRITLQDLRGSGSLASVPNVVVALERDRQNSDERIANTTTVRVLKNRLTGRAGVASALYYNRATGRLQEINFALDDTGQLLLEPSNE